MTWKLIKLATALTAAVALTGMSATAATAGTPSGSWTQTDYNAAMSRANLYEQVLTRTTVAKVVHLRSIAAPQPGNGCSFEPFSAPVLAGGSLYATAYGHVVKYRPRTGQAVWDVVPDPTYSEDLVRLSVASGLVIVGEQYCGSVSDSMESVQAFNATTGVLVWSQDIVTPAPASMVVSGGFVVVAGNSPALGGKVAVLRLSTGALAWSRNAGDCGGYAFVVAQRVISNESDCATASVTARSLTTGAVLWRRSAAASSSGRGWHAGRGDSDALTGRHIIASTPSGTVVSLNPLTGATQYTLAGATNVLVVAGDRMFAACGSGVCGYSITSGGRQWDRPLGSAPQLAASAGGVLYLDNGQALNTGTGKVMATLWGGQAGALAVGNGRIAAVSVGTGQVLDLYGLPGY